MWTLPTVSGVPICLSEKVAGSFQLNKTVLIFPTFVLNGFLSTELPPQKIGNEQTSQHVHRQPADFPAGLNIIFLVKCYILLNTQHSFVLETIQELNLLEL